MIKEKVLRGAVKYFFGRYRSLLLAEGYEPEDVRQDVLCAYYEIENRRRKRNQEPLPDSVMVGASLNAMKDKIKHLVRCRYREVHEADPDQLSEKVAKAMLTIDRDFESVCLLHDVNTSLQGKALQATVELILTGRFGTSLSQGGRMRARAEVRKVLGPIYGPRGWEAAHSVGRKEKRKDSGLKQLG
jgi:hypothetical protein